MLLTIDQTEELLKIIDKNQLIATFQELGPDFLSVKDKEILEESGINLEGYKLTNDTVFTSFHFGLLSEALGQIEAKKLSYDQLKEYIKHGDYIPLTVREQAVIQSVKAQKLNDLKKLRGKIFQDVNQILVDQSLRAQQEFIREQIEEGYLDKKTVRQISNDIAEKTGDWSRDFDRIVAYTTTLAEQEGKAAMIVRNAGEDDPVVYKQVYDGACKHCVRLYLTNGIGSQPRLFSLSKLRENGTNIGKKVEDWRPTIGPIHPFCRCALMYLPKGYVWNDKTKQFEALQEDKKAKPKRPLIRVWIAGREVWV